MLTIRRLWLVAIMGGFALLWDTSSAQAAFELQVTSNNGGDTGVILDAIGVPAPPPGDTNAAAGVIAYSGVLPGDPFIALNVQLAQSKPFIGSPTDAQLDINFSLTKLPAGVSDTVTIKVTDTDFTDNRLGGVLTTSIGGTLPVGGALTAQTFKASSNQPFDTSGFAGTQLSFTTPPTSFSGNTSDGHPALGPYSMTQVVTILLPSSLGTILTTGNYKSDNTIVPEPSSLAIAGAGALVLIGYGLRRRTALGA